MIRYSKICPECGKENIIEMTQEQFDKYFYSRELIQNVFPEKTANEREIIMTGICPKCWKRILK